ncbi:hypothetical protein DH2020_021722 [Rehmannia glutinosa]|uniref:Uncharacterized protein n=1 Tax=Rehmannia glutinosa TaxID=99300 RepID=A0ABR0WBA4_REHGL
MSDIFGVKGSRSFYILVGLGFKLLGDDDDIRTWALTHMYARELHVYIESQTAFTPTRSDVEGGWVTLETEDEHSSDGFDCDLEEELEDNSDRLVASRPTRARRFESDEHVRKHKKKQGNKVMRLRRNQKTVKRRLCGIPGHNAATCPSKESNEVASQVPSEVASQVQSQVQSQVTMGHNLERARQSILKRKREAAAKDCLDLSSQTAANDSIQKTQGHCNCN